MSVEIPKRLQPSKEVLKRLFAVSGNVCAFPNCVHPLFDQDGVFVAQLCHIEAAERGGPRFRATSNNEERRALENLMLMCHRHHKVTDDTEVFSFKKLRRMKAAHEQRYAEVASKILGKTFTDITRDDQPTFPKTLRRFGQISNEDPADFIEFVITYAESLSRVPRKARSLLCLFLERDHDGEVRFSELKEISASKSSDLADDLSLLQKYGLLYIDQDAYGPRNPLIRIQDKHDVYYNPTKDLRDFADAAHIDLREIFCEMNFALLD